MIGWPPLVFCTKAAALRADVFSVQRFQLKWIRPAFDTVKRVERARIRAPPMPRILTEGSPGGIQKSYQKRLEQGSGVPRAMLPTGRRPPLATPPSWKMLIGGFCIRKQGVASRLNRDRTKEKMLDPIGIDGMISINFNHFVFLNTVQGTGQMFSYRTTTAIFRMIEISTYHFTMTEFSDQRGPFIRLVLWL